MKEMEFSGSLENIVHFYLEYRKTMSLVEKIEGLDLISLDHADMVNDCEGQTRRLLDFCGLDWEEECLKFYELDRFARTASYDQVRKPINNKGVGRWKKYEQQLQPAIELLQAGGIEIERA